MDTIVAAVIVVIPICVMLCFICDWLFRAARELDRIASSLFHISQDIEKIQRGVK